MKRFLPIFFLIFISILFFWQVIFRGNFPIPSDTIIGLYHPFRDLYSKEYPRGVPFKNFLTTDPVRQQYPWRKLSVENFKKGEIPIWNPYSFSGTPHFANFQSATFYPLNILFFISPFDLSWSFLILLSPFLAGVFLYFFLFNLKLNRWACLLGAISFSFSGFFISWLEWNTVLHTALWLPLILLSIDKILNESKTKVYKISILNFQFSIWSLIFIFSLTSSFFAGHLQIFFYVFMVSFIYLIARWFQYGKGKRALLLFTIYYLLFTIFTVFQWYPTLQFILFSGREIDQILWQNPGWFIPWQNLVQFIVPDFFGNPTTLNYWGVFNYGEFVGYIGVAPLIFSLFALFSRHDKKTLFFGSLFFVSLIFSLPTIFAKLLFIFNIPFLNTAQPSRLIFISDFSLAVLASLGLDFFIKQKSKRGIIYILLFLTFAFFSLWIFVFYGNKLLNLVSPENIHVGKNNLILPSLVLISTGFIMTLLAILKDNKKLLSFFIFLIFIVTIFDLFRFGWKFTPFTKKEYLFPNTKTINFLQKNLGNFRIMTTDSRIFPPNFSIIYGLQSIDGYDPLFLRRYGELIASSERGEPNINPPFGFNRIITPHNFESKIINLLGVKYVLSLSDIRSEKLEKVFQEGETRVYENKEVLPRVFFVRKVQIMKGKDEAIKKMFDKDFDLRKSAIVEPSQGVNINPPLGCTKCEALIGYYSENKIVIKTHNQSDGFLVLTDSFYPSWTAEIDGRRTKIILADFNFRSLIVPKGSHEIVFKANLL